MPIYYSCGIPSCYSLIPLQSIYWASGDRIHTGGDRRLSLVDDQELTHRVDPVARPATVCLAEVGDRTICFTVEVVDDDDLELLRGQQRLGDAGEEQRFAGGVGNKRVWIWLLEFREGCGQGNSRLHVRADGVVRVGVEGSVEQ